MDSIAVRWKLNKQMGYLCLMAISHKVQQLVRIYFLHQFHGFVPSSDFKLFFCLHFKTGFILIYTYVSYECE